MSCHVMSWVQSHAQQRIYNRSNKETTLAGPIAGVCAVGGRIQPFLATSTTSRICGRMAGRTEPAETKNLVEPGIYQISKKNEATPVRTPADTVRNGKERAQRTLPPSADRKTPEGHGTTSHDQKKKKMLHPPTLPLPHPAPPTEQQAHHHSPHHTRIGQ